MRRSILASALALSGCTLVTGGLTPPTCEQNDQCAVLNEMHAIANDACELYQCSPSHVCELQARDDDQDGLVAEECAGVPLAQGKATDCNDEVPSGTEICNGIDDDCDDVIDERFVVDGVASNPLPAAMPASLIAGSSFSANGSVGYATASNAFAVAYAESNGGTYGIVSGASASSPTPIGFLRTDRLDVLSPTLVAGCHTLDPTQTNGYSTAACNVGEAALGLTDDDVFATVINRSGCGAGQVRVGYFPRTEDPGQIIQRGPARRSNAFAGIDVETDTEGRFCTGASRSSGVHGAARPSIVAAGEQALTAWIADAFTRTECGGDPADVEILGLHLQEDASHDGWVTASNEGQPQVIGQTAGGGRPGIAASEGMGYVVGFGAPGGGIHLVFVDSMEQPSPFTDGAPDDRTGLETPPLAIHDLGTIDTQGPADDVVLAFGAILVGGVEVGVAWREGCGADSQTIHFRQLFLTTDGSSIDESKSFDAIELTPAPSPAAGPPAIAYTFRGMLEDGAERGRPGGFVVAWSDASNQDPGPNDDSSILARRISDADGALLSPDELLVLNAPGDVTRLSPVLYTDDATDQVLYGFLGLGAESGFRGAALTCTPP